MIRTGSRRSHTEPGKPLRRKISQPRSPIRAPLTRFYARALIGFLSLLVSSVAHGQSDVTKSPISASSLSAQQEVVATPSLAVAYDRPTETISLWSHHAPLATVLREISRKTG